MKTVRERGEKIREKAHNRETRKSAWSASPARNEATQCSKTMHMHPSDAHRKKKEAPFSRNPTYASLTGTVKLLDWSCHE